jgi:hypothetical protein
MRRSQTELGALVIDTDFRYALFTPSLAKTDAEQAVCRRTGVRFAEVPPALRAAKALLRGL